MPKSRIIVVLGAIIALLPVLGFPRSWEIFFQIFAGLSIVVLSVWATIDKKLMLKHKAQQRALRKTSDNTSDSAQFSPNVVPPVTTTSGKRVTDFYPKTAPPGRRVTDLNPTISNSEEKES